MKKMGELYPKQRKILLLSLLLAGIVMIVGLVKDQLTREVGIQSLKRPKANEEDKSISLLLEFEKGEEKEKFLYEGTLGVRKLTKEESESVIKEAFSCIEQGMFHEREDKDHVKSGVKIPERLPDQPVSISWEAEDSEVFWGNGEVNPEKVGKEGKRTTLSIKVAYGEEEEVRFYEIYLLPREMTGEAYRKRMKMEMDRILESNAEDEVILPEEMESVKIRYWKPKEKDALFWGGGSFLAVFVLYFYFKNQNDKKKKQRERELREGYAFFVGRFVVLLGAGLNLLAIWKKLQETGCFNQSLEEEIRLTLREIANGKTEKEAYENFGRRIGGMQYNKFASILTENLKMGSSQILTRLIAEAREAMLERRNQAKSIGETMGTKLLLPMMLELVLILLVIMIPSMLSVSS